VAEVFRQQGGSDAWWKLPIRDLLPKRYWDQADKLQKGDQVFDVWFDNALTWNYVLSDGDYHETNQVTAQLTERFRQLA
jgi:isoleucyl-tRNA synthetase